MHGQQNAKNPQDNLRSSKTVINNFQDHLKRFYFYIKGEILGPG